MAWDIAATKQKIYDAALAEFAEHGPGATTIDRIAKRAGVNRERVYSYFGDKPALFAAVVRTEVDKLAEAVPLTITSAADVADWAGRAFDYQLAHPELPRLTIWEGLTSGAEVADESERGAVYAAKTAAVASAQEKGLIDEQIPAPDLVLLLVALSSYWPAAPQIARMLTSGLAPDPDETARRRAAVVEAARRVVEPRVS